GDRAERRAPPGALTPRARPPTRPDGRCRSRPGLPASARGRGRRAGVTTSGLRVVRVEGDATARGRRAGELLGDLVARSLAFYRDYLGDRSADLEPFRRAAEQALPEHMAWLDAFAAGAEVAPAELFAVNALEELEQLAPVERCSTFTALGERGTLLGHNEMWLEGDRGN